ncbi:YbaB/EbfC family nucleoid-associated protein [Actinophytocola sp.]|uniref:YbaB/EbfC family nucleoid-associated protein n=1 Tax=Actinophytocola sp. TaxID=1872138 RepID=UPI002ED5E117
MDATEVVARMDVDLERTRQWVEQLRRTTVTEEIGRGLGKVVVNGYGHLQSVTVDREAFHMVGEDVLATRIVDAVNRAESRVERLRAEEGGLR